MAPSADGSYFIDRSSKWFRCILDYLRNYQLSVDLFALSQTERDELKTELEFYGLASALDMFGTRAALSRCSARCSFACLRIRFVCGFFFVATGR